MSYEVTATRRRPQHFDDLVGQEFVAETLKNAIKSKKIAHAYLFSGPRGCGKTSSARILAKALNCKEGPTDSPCGKCSNCQEITKGSSLDVIEIDGASNTSVENIRQIKDEVLFPPTNSKYKIYIIDEVHMLSTSAFNALLKTIEEPPEYVIFIFATTELQKVPATIKSRCQQFNFRLVAIDKVKECLKEASDELGIEADDEALYWIARESTGSMRDAYTLFDQVVAFSDGHITYDKIKDKLGLVGIDNLNAIFEACCTNNTDGAMQLLDEFLQKGVSIEQLISTSADYLRSILLLKNNVQKESLLGNNPERYSSLVLERWTTIQTERALSIFLNLYRDIRYSLSPRYEIELAFSRLCWINEYVSPSEVKKALDAAIPILASGVPSSNNIPDAIKNLGDFSVPNPKLNNNNSYSNNRYNNNSYNNNNSYSNNSYVNKNYNNNANNGYSNNNYSNNNGYNNNNFDNQSPTTSYPKDFPKFSILDEEPDVKNDNQSFYQSSTPKVMDSYGNPYDGNTNTIIDNAPKPSIEPKKEEVKIPEIAKPEVQTIMDSSGNTYTPSDLAKNSSSAKPKLSDVFPTFNTSPSNESSNNSEDNEQYIEEDMNYQSHKSSFSFDKGIEAAFDAVTPGTKNSQTIFPKMNINKNQFGEKKTESSNNSKVNTAIDPRLQIIKPKKEEKKEVKKESLSAASNAFDNIPSSFTSNDGWSNMDEPPEDFDYSDSDYPDDDNFDDSEDFEEQKTFTNNVNTNNFLSHNNDVQNTQMGQGSKVIQLSNGLEIETEELKSEVLKSFSVTDTFAASVIEKTGEWIAYPSSIETFVSSEYDMQLIQSKIISISNFIKDFCGKPMSFNVSLKKEEKAKGIDKQKLPEQIKLLLSTFKGTLVAGSV